RTLAYLRLAPDCVIPPCGALLWKCSWQAEVREQAPVAEPGDCGDAVALQREHHQPLGSHDRCLRVADVAAERGLTVGTRGYEPEAADNALAVAEEPGDRLPALVLEGLGRHREPGVVCQ